MKYYIFFVFIFLIFNSTDICAQRYKQLPQNFQKGDVSIKNYLRNIDPQKHADLRLLSWNVYMLPGIAPCPGRIPRAKAIGTLLKDAPYDIICLQETFHKKARDIITDSLRKNFPFVIGPVHPPTSGQTSSGLTIYSRIPLDSVKAVEYSQKKRSDKFSRKGAILVRGKIEDKIFHLICTHAQAQDEPEIRLSQFKELRDSLFFPYKDSVLTHILCGDLNVPSTNKEEYNRMLNELFLFDYGNPNDSLYSWNGITNKLASSANPKVETLDYFLCSLVPSRSTKQTKIVTFKKSWSRKRDDLSDHYAVSLELRVK